MFMITRMNPNFNTDSRTLEQRKIHIEELSLQEIQERYLRLIQIINPEHKCVCSDLSEVRAGDEKACAYHARRVSWIIHQARQDFPPS